MGSIGAELAWWSFRLLGVVAWLVPAFLFWTTWVSIRIPRQVTWLRVVVMFICLFAACGLGTMFQGSTEAVSNTLSVGWGGQVGEAVYEKFFFVYFGPIGSTLILASFTSSA